MDPERTNESAPSRIYIGFTSWWYEDKQKDLHDIEYTKTSDVEQLLGLILFEVYKERSRRRGSTIHRKACDNIHDKVLEAAKTNGLNEDIVEAYFLQRQGEHNLSQTMTEQINKKAFGLPVLNLKDTRTPEEIEADKGKVEKYPELREKEHPHQR